MSDLLSATGIIQTPSPTHEGVVTHEPGPWPHLVASVLPSPMVSLSPRSSLNTSNTFDAQSASSQTLEVAPVVSPVCNDNKAASAFIPFKGVYRFNLCEDKFNSRRPSEEEEAIPEQEAPPLVRRSKLRGTP